jgi:CubicO group peptidase (beta-lactamase class C family)
VSGGRLRVAVLAAMLLAASSLLGAQTGGAAPTTEEELLAQMLVNRHAKRVCSGVFLSGRTAAAVLAEDHDTDPESVDIDVNRAAGRVRIGAVGRLATAVYRPGLGCTILGRLSQEQLLVQDTGDVVAASLDPDVAWPRGAEVQLATPSGLDRVALQAALEEAFSEPFADKARGTRAALVVYDGQVVAERYAPGFGHDRPLIIWSMTKSLTSALVGLLVGDGLLDVAAPAPVPEWATAGDPRREITLDQLLRMSSGLKFEEVYQQGLIDVVVMLFGMPDTAHYAASQPLESPPDTVWAYSSGTTNIISRVVRLALGGELSDYASFARERLLDPLGMTHTVMELDEAGTFVGSSFAYSTPRDLARFGQLYLQDGVWNGERLLPEGWVEYSTTPTPAAPRGEYGAQFWLNAGDPTDASKRQWPSVPTDAYGLSGFEGQSVTVVPSKKAVVVRLGRTPDRSAFDLDAFLGSVLDALP